MTGIILCGGGSSRMGTDKGLIETNSYTWAQIASRKIAVLGLASCVSVNATQYNSYTSFFSNDRLIEDNAAVNVHGPLRGILSAHVEMPGEDLLVLACDMPLMETTVLEQLYSFSKKQSADAFVFINEDGYEPLCGIYTARGLAHIMDLLKNGKLVQHSMKYALEQLSTYTIELLPEQKKCFLNFNAHADLNNL